MTIVIIGLLVLAALLYVANRGGYRLLVAARNGDRRTKSAMLRAGGALFLLYAVVALVAVLWFFVAAILNQSEMLHEKGVPAMAIGVGFVNLLAWFMAIFMAN